MTTHRFLLLLISFFFYLQVGYNQTLYPILFAATDDPSIGSHMSISFKDLKNLMLDIEDSSSYTVDKTHYYSGADFTLSNLKSAIQTINPQPNDAIIFWYIGHGFIDKKLTTPNLMVLPEGAKSQTERDANSINLQGVYDTLANKCRFVWVIGDASNADLDKVLPANQINNDGTFKRNIDKQKDTKEGNIQNNFNNLLIQKSKTLFQSSLKGKSAWSSDQKGSFYTRAFLRAFTSRMNSDGIANIRQFNNEVNRTYENMVDAAVEYAFKDKEKTKIAKPTFFKRIAQFLFQGKANKRLRKKYRKVLENGSLEELGNIIPKPRIDESSQMTFLAKRPTVYYLVRGIFVELNAKTIVDSTEVAECYCTANAVMDFGINTDKEYRLLRVIEKYNANNGDILGMKQAGGKKNWLRKKCNFYQKHLSNVQNGILEEQSTLQGYRSILETNLAELKIKQIKLAKKLIEIRDNIRQNDIIISTTYKQWQEEDVEVSYSIVKIPESKKDQECLRSTLRKLQQGIALTENCERIIAKYITIRLKKNTNKKLNSVQKITTTGYELNQHCTDEIKSTTGEYFKYSLASLNNIPAAYRAKMKVNIRLKGKADSRPCNSMDCIYSGSVNATYPYINQFGEHKNFTIVKGRRQAINNEQLAVVRAICAQNKAKEILNSFGVSDIDYEYMAEVHLEEDGVFRGRVFSLLSH